MASITGISKGTKTPTGLSVARNGNAYTLSWKIADNDHGAGQNLQYRVNGGSWINVAISNTATSYTVTASNVVVIMFQVRGCRKNEKKKNQTVKYSWSAWASRDWFAVAPATPTLTYKNEGVNKGTIEWSCPNDVTNTAVFDHAEYQTTILRSDRECDFAGVTVVTKGASGSELVVEDTTEISAGNFVRWFRIRAIGPGGASAWVTAYHAYGKSAAPTVTGASATTYGSTTRVTTSWTNGYNRQYPIDKLKVQYVIDTPTDVALTAPSSGWSDVKTDIAANGFYSMDVTNISDAIDEDECLWVRVAAEHDNQLSYSNEMVAQIGRLAAPDIDATPNTSTGYVSISITENTDCEVAATAIFYRAEDNPSLDRIVGILANGVTSATIEVPEVIGATHTCFGAYAFVGTYSGTAITKLVMRSAAEIDSDIPAVAPANVSVMDGPEDGVVRIMWDWTWGDATEAELSWSDIDYSWESTNEPSTYRVKDPLISSWLIAGLEVGKRWYFRVRLVDTSGDTEIVGPWSGMVSFDLSGGSGKPILTLSKSVIDSGESITARWAYASSGSDEQVYAEICLVTFDENTGDPIYGDMVAYTDKDQHVDIVREWTTDETYYFAVRITLEPGTQTVWSDPVDVLVADPVSIVLDSSDITMGNIVNAVKITSTTVTPGYDPYVTVNRYSETIDASHAGDQAFKIFMKGEHTEFISITNHDTPGSYTKHVTEHDYTFGRTPGLRSLPFDATIIGAGDTGTTMLSIIRAEDFHIERPDEKNDDGYYGEVIATHSQIGEAEITITKNDLIGKLDLGAKYYLVGKIVDAYGRSASFQYPFWVDWTVEARVPKVSVEMDPYLRAAKITPIYPSTGPTTATCDIYRLSADKPELVVKGAAFGTTYVDPYPAFGQSGGHRLVTISKNGDYATSDGLGWYDAQSDDGDILDDVNMVIDVNGDQIVLPYNLELSNKWGKDFKRTSYLGGSVQGDWNPAVTRDLSANTVLVRGDDLDRQLAMRGLAGFAGIAHVRTPDGSSLTVNIQIDERQSYDTKKITYTLTMQAIDPEGPVGMTLTEWETLHPIGE